MRLLARLAAENRIWRSWGGAVLFKQIGPELYLKRSSGIFEYALCTSRAISQPHRGKNEPQTDTYKKKSNAVMEEDAYSS